MQHNDPLARDERVAACLVEVARALGERLAEMTAALFAELVDSIPELRGEQLILELLRSSIQANIDTFVHLAQYSLPMEDITPPTAAVAYAQRLAQRGTSSTSLVRAYRLGQRRIMDLSFTQIALVQPDASVAFATAQAMHQLVSLYVDQIAEKVVGEYESERERWLANRNTVRTTMVASLLAGDEVDVATAESALGYRLRQHHLGVVLWDADGGSSTTALRRLETVVALIGEAVGATGQPLFLPRDGALGWAWIPLGPHEVEVDVEMVRRHIASTAGSIRVALGTIGAAMPGFRTTHLDASRAHAVATIAADRARLITTYAEPGVRAAALLTRDLDSARALVSEVLGPLAADDEPSERLRETLLVFLGEGGSYRSAGERLHVHRNTVKYRVDRAVDLRGRPLHDDRFNLELALLACQWLGQAVLAPSR
ncbi:MAG: PucR family transcriptional regulator [Marmoricola sp.]